MIKKIGNYGKKAFFFGKNAQGEEVLLITKTVDINETEDVTLAKETSWLVQLYDDVYVTYENRYE